MLLSLSWSLRESCASYGVQNDHPLLAFLKVWENHLLTDHLPHRQYSSASAALLKVDICDKCHFLLDAFCKCKYCLQESMALKPKQKDFTQIMVCSGGHLTNT